MQYIRALLHYFTLTINEEKDTKWKIQTTFLSFLTRSKLNIPPLISKLTNLYVLSNILTCHPDISLNNLYRVREYVPGQYLDPLLECC